MQSKTYGFVSAFIVAGLIYFGGKIAMTPRGIRNNNPGNIRHGDQWAGMADAQLDPSFVTFDDPRYGIRAMARILSSYQRRGVTTLREIITTWAPPNENDTASYISSVSRVTDIMPDDIVTRDKWPQLIEAIIRHENGQQPYNMAQIEEGISWA